MVRNVVEGCDIASGVRQI